MFIAKYQNGSTVSLLNETKPELTRIKNNGPFFCPACNSELILKIGSKKLPHFAHKQICSIKPEGETETHMLGKLKLFQWLNKQNYHPVLEPYLAALGQRPDLLFLYKGKQMAVEFQCSIIPFELMKQRTINYMQNSYESLWIMHDKKIKTQYNRILHFNEFLSFFIQKSSKNQHSIISFSPELDQITVYHNIIPYSVNRAFVQVKRFTLGSTFETITTTPYPTDSFYYQWVEQTEKWLTQVSILPNARRNTFLQFLYNRHIHPTELPAEVGIPLPNMFLIKNPPIEWQTYIWFYFLYQQQIGKTITIAEVQSFIMYKMSQLIKFRDLPNFTIEDLKKLLMDYLIFLIQVGFFTKQGDTLIVRKKPTLIKINVDRKETRSHFFRQYKGLIMKPFY